MSHPEMPALDEGVIARRDEIVAALRAIVPDGTIDNPVGLKPYESDGLTAYRQPPLVVVLPETVEQVAAVLRWCHSNDVKVVPRGAGTSLSGGALPVGDGVLMSMMKFNRVKAIDFQNRIAVVQPGVTNLGITRAVEHEGYCIEPQPMPEGGQYRLCAVITREVGGETRQHRLIRADLFPDADTAAETSVRKAKQMIAEQGDRIFG